MLLNNKISVIIPIYNIEQYISKCVESVCSQDYDNIEIILVDDGSTDNSGMICENLKSKDSRIKVFHKKNGGLSDARNFGVIEATGEFVLFLDGDDYVDSDYVSSLYNSLTKNEASMVCSPLIFEYASGKQETIQNFNEKIVSFEEIIDVVFRAKYSIGVSACSKLMRVEDVRKHPFPLGKYHEDMITIEEIIMENDRIVILPHPTYHYVQRTSSITHRDVNFDSLNYGLTYLEIKIKQTNSQLCKKAYIHRMFGLMNSYCRVIDTKKNRYELMNVQCLLRKYLKDIIVADKETSLKDKIKFAALCGNRVSFSLLQFVERK